MSVRPKIVEFAKALEELEAENTRLKAELSIREKEGDIFDMLEAMGSKKSVEQMIKMCIGKVVEGDPKLWVVQKQVEDEYRKTMNWYEVKKEYAKVFKDVATEDIASISEFYRSKAGIAFLETSETLSNAILKIVERASMDIVKKFGG